MFFRDRGLPRTVALTFVVNHEYPSTMSSASIGAALDRVRAFRKFRDWAPFRFATEAGVAEATLRGMDDRAWNPTVRTLERLEAIIPKDWQPDAAPKRKAKAA